MPEVSVILPNYNHKRFLKQRIESVLDQTFEDFELIILDDSSIDGSVEIIETYRQHPKVTKIIFNQSNGGSPFRQWRKGIMESSGKYLWIAESDDFVDLNFLETAIRTLKADQSQLFFARSVHINETGDKIRSVDWWYNDLSASKWKKSYTNSSEKEIQSFLSFKNYICNASSVVFENNDSVLQYLKTVEDWKFCGDWMFWLMYLNGSQKISFSPATINYWREHHHTSRANVEYSRNLEMLKIYHWVTKTVKPVSNYRLLRYYYQNHFYKIPRGDIKTRWCFILDGIRYSKLLVLIELQYIFYPKSLAS
jgi:glycosyltransferase involved in cell wall biosynthesis